MRFKGKVAVVTGGGTGIGRATAIEFAKEGARVVIAGRREAPLKEVAEEISKLGGNAFYMLTDVKDSRQVDELINKAVAEYGRVDVMFNNAGNNLTKDLVDVSDEEVEDLVSTHIKGGLYGMRAAIRQMKKQGGGAIVNMSSMSGMLAHPYRAPYCACKAAIINMTRSAALEYAEENIRVNVICPGVIDTPMARADMDGNPEVVDQYIQSIPMKRMGTSEEIARAVLFLASEDASYITGAYLAADGGFVAGK